MTAEIPSGKSGVPVLFWENGRPRILAELSESRDFNEPDDAAKSFSNHKMLLAEWDCCWLDDTPITTLDQWWTIVDSERLPVVEGAFALAWITANGKLRMARDSVGERSLYYAPLQGAVLCASTLRALLNTGMIERRLNLPGIAAYLSYAYVPGRETLIQGVFELLPGEIIEWQATEHTSQFFWSLPAETHYPESEQQLRHRLRLGLSHAVRRRLPANQAVGASLSGGVDSSLVVALAAALHPEPVHTYSLSFGTDYPNELPFSSLIARHCATHHHILELSPATVMKHLDASIALLNDPIGDPLTVPNALLFREASGEVEVVLNGEGGDPCFGGPKNLPMLLAELYGDGANRHSGNPAARAASYLRAHLKCYDDLADMLTPRMRDALQTEPLEEQLLPYFNDTRWRNFIAKLQAINVRFKGPHHILNKVAALSRPFGIHARSPLFDRAIVEMAFAIPPQLKLRGSVEKYLLKQAVADLLPASILERPKSGMLVPVESWFQGSLLPFARERLLDGLAPWGLIEKKYLERLVSGKLTGLRPRRGAKIWLLITLESWLRTVILCSGNNRTTILDR